MNEAQNHKVIAEHVWPNASISILTGGALNQNVVVRTTQDQKSQFDFNLLETDSNWLPTMQAKAHTLDVLVWMLRDRLSDDKDAEGVFLGSFFIDDVNEEALCQLCSSVLSHGNTCEAIYKEAVRYLYERRNET